jgi:hypothetical protein
VSDQELRKVSTDQDLSEAIRRAFSHYSLERPVAELLDHPPRRRGSRSGLAVRGLAVGGLAAVAMLLVALWPGDGQDTALGPVPAGAFASWTPRPQRADSDSLADAVARCNRADPGGAELPVAATERRGGYTLVFRTDGARRAVCIAGPQNQLLSLPAPPKLAAGEAPPEQPNRFPIEEVVFPGPRNPLAEQVGIVVGRVGADVRAVEIRPDDGVTVTATVSRGYFVAWWPGTAEDAAHAMITARKHAGRGVADFKLLGGDASFAEFARNPSAVEPLPAEVSEVDGSGEMPIMSLLTPQDDFGREIVVHLSAGDGARGTAPDCQEFSTDEEWRAASPSLRPKCRYPSG